MGVTLGILTIVFSSNKFHVAFPVYSGNAKYHPEA